MDVFEIRHRNVRALVADLEREAGRSGARAGGLAGLAQRLGKQQSQVSHFASDSPIKNIGPKIAREIDAAFGKNPGWLDAPHWEEIGAVEPVSLSDAIPSIIPSSELRRVPVVGTASMGMDGFWVELDYPDGHGDGYFEFPTRDPDAYVVQLRGGSMHPAIRSGWYAMVEPNMPLVQGEFVLIKLTDGRSTVKELLWHRNGEYTVEAAATGERMTLREVDVELIHSIGAILAPSRRQY